MKKPDVNKLYTLEHAAELTVPQVHQLYREHINPAQVKLISSFAFGRELAVSAQGCVIRTDRGSEVLDFTGGIGVLSHGHNHPRILAARLRFQQETRMEVHKNYFSPWLAALSANIAALLPGELSVSYFPNSGAEAVEGAVKMAYKAADGQRKRILHSDISYHGKLLGAQSLTASAEINFRFPQIPGTQAFRYGDLAHVTELIEASCDDQGRSDIYALLVEPFSASSMRACSQEFLQGVRELCDQHEIVLIFDEVFSGWAKTGELFYFMRYPLVPDILVMSKALGGGKASIAGYTATTSLFKKAYGKASDATLHSTTYNGFGEEACTALEAVNIIVEEDFPARAHQLEVQIGSGLQHLQDLFPQWIEDVRGAGAHWGLKLKLAPSLLTPLLKGLPDRLMGDPLFVPKLVTGAVINELYERHGVLTYFSVNREILLTISPPLVAEKVDVERFLRALEEVLQTGPTRLIGRFVKQAFFH